MAPSGHGKGDDREPEFLDGLDDLDELAESDRLGDVAVGVQPVAPQDILLVLSSRFALLKRGD